MQDHPIGRNIEHQGRSVPTFLYGTAWKEDRTAELTQLAIESGFLGIDTANQRRHYIEAAVGKGIGRALAAKGIKREDLFLQTKFTPVGGQDHRLPYDPEADYASQIRQSIDSSLEHLQTTYLDAYILHGPMSRQGLSDADWQVWQAMEDLQKSGAVRMIGISNVDWEQLRLLVGKAEIKPTFVQNRCFAQTQWDVRIRSLCRSHDILYQGFSLLTANAVHFNRPEMHMMAKRHGCTLPQLVFRFALQIGMIPLTGTTNQVHMQQDLAVYDMHPLDAAEAECIENIASNAED